MKFLNYTQVNKNFLKNENHFKTKKTNSSTKSKSVKRSRNSQIIWLNSIYKPSVPCSAFPTSNGIFGKRSIIVSFV